MSLHADNIIEFLASLKWPGRLPAGVHILDPWKDSRVMEACGEFYRKYFSDRNPRTLILGINPGRFGGGTTGIAFTDPIRLVDECNIPNPFTKRPELSSEFVYEVIRRYGGAQDFYGNFYINSVVPLGFTRDGKNLNYYDTPELIQASEKLVPKWMNRHLSVGSDRRRCICLGEGKNLTFLQRLNDLHQWFSRIDALPHPRFIMQYRRKQLSRFAEQYLKVLSDPGTT